MAVIPCHNEAQHVGEIVVGVCQHLPTVIVVDDGSTDETADVARQAGAVVVRHVQNEGKGAALRAGWERARVLGFTWAINLDGDGQHAPADIPKFFACAERSYAAMIIGNRFENAQSMPWIRRQVNGWMTRRLSRLLGVPLADSQCGFRLLNLEILSQIRLATTHFEIESELLVAFIASRQPVAFVPIQVIYPPRSSKIRPCTDGWRWWRWWRAQRRPN